MMECFLCGHIYDEDSRFDGVELLDDTSNETVRIKQIVYDHHVLRLCPLCVQAAVFGNILNGGNLHWIYDVGIEDDYIENVQAQTSDQVEFPLMMDDVPLNHNK